MQTLPVQIRFNDVDMFGHLNNNVYLQFLDMGKYAYFRSMMQGTFGSEPTGPVVANINIDFLAPTMIDEQLEVRTAVSSVGESSLTLEQWVVNKSGQEKCHARTVMVNLDLKTHRPTPVTAEWRARFAAEEGHDF